MIKNSETAKEILYLLRRMQRNNRFIIEDQDSGLSILDSTLLLEVDTHPEISLTTAGLNLGLDKGTISQAIRRLSSLHLVEVQPNPSDKRIRQITLSQKGKDILNRYDHTSDLLLEEFTLGFSIEESRFIAQIFQTIADVGCTVPGKLRKKDHPIRLQMRRLTVAFGLLHRNFRDSGQTLAEFNILAQIRDRPCRAVDIIKELGLAQNYVSQIVSSLIRSQLVTQTKDSSDSRSRFLSLTKQGLKILASIEDGMMMQISEALKTISHNDTIRFISLLRRFTGEDTQLLCIIGQDNRSIARSLETENELNDCRVLFARLAMSSQHPLRIPSTFFSIESQNYGLFQGTSICAAVECQLRNDHCEVINCTYDQTKVSENDWVFFVRTCFLHVAKLYRVDFFKILTHGITPNKILQSDTRLNIVWD